MIKPNRAEKGRNWRREGTRREEMRRKSGVRRKGNEKQKITGKVKKEREQKDWSRKGRGGSRAYRRRGRKKS